MIGEFLEFQMKLLGRLLAFIKRYLFLLCQKTPLRKSVRKINLCSGSVRIPGYLNIDISYTSDLPLNLAKQNLPFLKNTVDVVVCMSAINYFTYKRAGELIKEVYRILKPEGIARFGVQDLQKLAELYVKKDKNFFFQKLPNGRERFEGKTLGDKFVAWFYGYEVYGQSCQYFYDFESLAYLFREARFSVVELKKYRESALNDIELIDNRANQMFFLEARK